MTNTHKPIPAEWRVFHSIVHTIQLGKFLHEPKEVALYANQISPEDRARAKDLVDRYLALCADAQALIDEHRPNWFTTA